MVKAKNSVTIHIRLRQEQKEALIKIHPDNLQSVLQNLIKTYIRVSYPQVENNRGLTEQIKELDKQIEEKVAYDKSLTEQINNLTKKINKSKQKENSKDV